MVCTHIPLHKAGKCSFRKCQTCYKLLNCWICLTCQKSFCEKDTCGPARLSHFSENAECAIFASFTPNGDAIVGCERCSISLDNVSTLSSFEDALKDYEASARVEAVLVSAQQTQDKIAKRPSAVEEFDKKWKEFSDRFDAVLKKNLEGIEAALRHEPNLLAQAGLTGGHLARSMSAVSEEDMQVLEGDVTVGGLVSAFQAGSCGKKIVVLAGAGISVSAGIPDFRTPGTGLYSNLQTYDVPSPQSIFDISYFKENPKPFCILSQELYPGNFKPTPSHCFVKLLCEKGLLLRHYTQNIDTLERQTDIPEDKLVEAHGSFQHAHCINPDCKALADPAFVRDILLAGDVPYCPHCSSLVKPDIVFFGENLPQRFVDLHKKDLADCDLLIIMGTSLAVQPFASLVSMVHPSVPRLLLNRDKICAMDLAFDLEQNYRDIYMPGNCDDSVAELASLLGFKSDFDRLCTTYCGTTHAPPQRRSPPPQSSAQAGRPSPPSSGSKKLPSSTSAFASRASPPSSLPSPSSTRTSSASSSAAARPRVLPKLKSTTSTSAPSSTTTSPSSRTSPLSRISPSSRTSPLSRISPSSRPATASRTSPPSDGGGGYSGARAPPSRPSTGNTKASPSSQPTSPRTKPSPPTSSRTSPASARVPSSSASLQRSLPSLASATHVHTKPGTPARTSPVRRLSSFSGTLSHSSTTSPTSHAHASTANTTTTAAARAARASPPRHSSVQRPALTTAPPSVVAAPTQKATQAAAAARVSPTRTLTSLRRPSLNENTAERRRVSPKKKESLKK